MKHKKNLSLVKNNWNKLPYKAIEINLSLGALGLLGYLISLPEDFDPSTKHLTNIFKCDRRKIARLLGELREHNVINRYYRGQKGQNSKYEFMNPKGWK
jgi:hypothetical protein